MGMPRGCAPDRLSHRAPACAPAILVLFPVFVHHRGHREQLLRYLCALLLSPGALAEHGGEDLTEGSRRTGCGVNRMETDRDFAGRLFLPPRSQRALHTSQGPASIPDAMSPARKRITLVCALVLVCGVVVFVLTGDSGPELRLELRNYATNDSGSVTKVFTISNASPNQLLIEWYPAEAETEDDALPVPNFRLEPRVSSRPTEVHVFYFALPDQRPYRVVVKTAKDYPPNWRGRIRRFVDVRLRLETDRRYFVENP